MKRLLQSRSSHVVAFAFCALLMAFAVSASAFAQHANHTAAPAKLVADVRAATQQYVDVNNAEHAGYAPAFGCVSGPDHGAMGVHYVNSTLVTGGQIQLAQPQALIYEPVGNARQLVGVEYIVDSATWLQNHDNIPPTLEGQDFQFVASPNRFNLNSFFELHVWAWRDNPQGSFVDWNDNVSCNGD